MMSCFNKRADPESTDNEVAIIKVVEERAPGIALPYCCDSIFVPHKIAILEYPINLTKALQSGRIDSCGSIIVKVVKRIKEMCDALYAVGITHYDLHTSNIVLKFLGTDSMCMPDVRFIDWVLSCDYVSKKRPPHVRMMEVPDPLYDWYFFCFSFIHLFKVLSVEPPVIISSIEPYVLEYNEKKEAAGHEWSLVKFLTN